MLLAAVGWWFVLLVAIALLGGLRDMVLQPRIGELAAHQIGTLAACAAAFALIVLFVRWRQPTETQAWTIGVLWLGMCLAFEFGFFHYVAGRPWSELLRDYDLLHGRLLLLLWVTTLVGPWAALRLCT